MLKLSNEQIVDYMKEIKRFSTEVFKDMPNSNKQKLVYVLLNKIRSNSQEEFLWTLIRQVNAYNREESLKEPIEKLTENISRVWVDLSSDTFSKYAYSIVLGIMSGKSNKNLSGGD